jgi:hypothetical protein
MQKRTLTNAKANLGSLQKRTLANQKRILGHKKMDFSRRQKRIQFFGKQTLGGGATVLYCLPRISTRFKKFYNRTNIWISFVLLGMDKYSWPKRQKELSLCLLFCNSRQLFLWNRRVVSLD